MRREIEARVNKGYEGKRKEESMKCNTRVRKEWRKDQKRTKKE